MFHSPEGDLPRLLGEVNDWLDKPQTAPDGHELPAALALASTQDGSAGRGDNNDALEECFVPTFPCILIFIS